ncbi:MAG: three-Cys-motif partner protein TcmP [Vicinamibacterales bacterium]
MTTPNPSDAVHLDEIGYWSEVKLAIVQQYSKAYSTILARQPYLKHLYIDGFAGAGTHLSKTSGQLVPGSPLNALVVEPRFTELHFIDLDGGRADRLRELAAEDDRVTVYEGDCNEVLLQKVFPRCQYKDYRRGLCLLDPYGLNVDWVVLQQAGQMRSIDLFFSFMIGDANRNVFWRDPSRVAPDQAARMDRAWGDSSWRNAAYRSEGPNLFGDEVLVKRENADIAEAFRLRLQNVAGFAQVPQPMPMRNSKGAVIYYLYFATHNEAGARIAKHIFRTFEDRGIV